MSLDVLIERRWKGFSLNAQFEAVGGILGILGASGSGKSMTLKCIAGIESPDAGRIVSDSRVLFDSKAKLNLRPQQRRVGYLFQQYALFPHMTVGENIGCACEKGKQQEITRWMKKFQLQGLEARYPAQLSGGQQQRVALARCLAAEPEVLLLDEPFSALDGYLREQVQLELLNILRDYPGQVVLVTHNRDEAYQMCKNLVVLEGGRCIACGDTKALFSSPGLVSVARLTGCKNFSRARRTGPNQIYAEDWGISLTVCSPIPDHFDAVGIHAQGFVPATETMPCINRIRIRVCECIEGPFVWNMLFVPDGVEAARPLWWTYEKNAGNRAVPDYLSIDPQSIFLLRSDGQTI